MSGTIEYGAIAPPTTEPPRVIAPLSSAVFDHRARRFAVLAKDHALSDWLRFLGRLSAAQHAALQALPAVPLPDAAALERAHSHRMPPVPAQTWQRHPAWRDVLVCLIDAVEAVAPAPGRAALAALRRKSAAEIEALAVRVLHTELYGPDAAVLPIVGAALQVYWTALAAGLGDGSRSIASLDMPGVCPCCGSLPVASIVRTAGEVGNLRYLHCSLCNTEWNLVRVKCACCDATANVSYRYIEGADLKGAAAMCAETCDDCMSYLKILYQERAPEGDPVADDLATLALDLLVDEAGYSRIGPNLLFVPGSS